MKVIFLAGSLNQGGAEFQILTLAKLFKEKGHEVEVFALTDYDFYKPFIQANSIKYTCLKNSQSKIKRILLTAKKLKSSKPDLVISYLKVVSQVAIVAKLISRSKAKFIIGERTSLIRPWHDYYYFNLLLFADYVTVNSITKLTYLERKFPLLRNRLGFIPNVIDVDNFSPNALGKNETDFTKIAFVGRISPEKNIIAMVQAIISLKESGYKIILEMYGDNKNKDYYKKISDLINKSSAEKYISFKGPREDVKEVYRNADLICLVSFFEGFSNVLAEALACGVPILASNIKENQYLVENGVNGFLVNPYDLDDLVGGFVKFLNLSSVEKDSIRENNRIKAKLIFEKEVIFKEYIRIIN